MNGPYVYKGDEINNRVISDNAATLSLNPSSKNNNVTQSGQKSFTTGDNSGDNSGEFGFLLSNNSGININNGGSVNDAINDAGLNETQNTQQIASSQDQNPLTAMFQFANEEALNTLFHASGSEMIKGMNFSDEPQDAENQSVTQSFNGVGNNTVNTVNTVGTQSGGTTSRATSSLQQNMNDLHELYTNIQINHPDWDQSRIVSELRKVDYGSDDDGPWDAATPFNRGNSDLTTVEQEEFQRIRREMIQQDDMDIGHVLVAMDVEQSVNTIFYLDNYINNWKITKDTVLDILKRDFPDRIDKGVFIPTSVIPTLIDQAAEEFIDIIDQGLQQEALAQVSAT